METHEKIQPYSLPGQRLEHILDQIGFKKGRGRMKLLHEIISSSQKYKLTDIKYPSVKSWFHNHAPPLRKVNMILDILTDNYVFDLDVEQIAVWWKVGGVNPYSTEHDLMPTEERDFLITALITEEANLINSNIEVSELLLVKEKIFQMYKDFSNPNIKEYPKEHARMLIKGILHSDI